MDARHRARNRNRTVAAIGAAVALIAAVVAGIVLAGDVSPGAGSPDLEAVPPPPAASDAGSGRAAPAAPSGTGAPVGISGTDPVTGKAVDLAAFTGKPIVLTIWASWCPGCNDEAPHLKRTIEARAGDVHFVGVNFRDDASGAKAFSDRHGLAYPSIADPEGARAFAVGLQGTPTTIFLDADRREIGRVVGPLDEAALNTAIDRITGA